MSLSAQTINLSENLDNFTYITGVAKARLVEFYGPWAIPVSRLSTSSYRTGLAPSGIPANDLAQFDIRRSGTSGLQLKALHADAFAVFYDVIGVKNPGGMIDPPPPDEAPGSPSTPTLASRTSTSLTLATVAGSGGTPTTYRWRISTNSTVSNQDPMHTSSSPSITITGLDEDTDYWIDVRAENSEGDSDYSGDLATSTLAGTGTTVSANAGSDVSVESGGSVGIGGVDTITNPVGTTTYSWATLNLAGGSLSSTTVQQPIFNAPTVTSDRSIVWSKTTTNNGVSDTDDVTITVMPVAEESPGTPSTPSVVTRGQNSLELSTTPGGGGTATLYRWRYSTNNIISNNDPMVTSTGPSVTISALAEDTDYWIDVSGGKQRGR